MIDLPISRLIHPRLLFGICLKAYAWIGGIDESVYYSKLDYRNMANMANMRGSKMTQTIFLCKKTSGELKRKNTRRD